MLRVVIAEDDFRVAQVHEKFLAKIKQVELAAKAKDCAETLAAVKQERPDLVLLDNYMPDGLGIELIDELRKESPETDIILVSAANEREYIETALRKGVKGIILKPAELSQFTATIEKYRKDREKLSSQETIDQEYLDELFGVKAVKKEAPAVKGIDPLTMQKVQKLLEQYEEGVTAEKMGEEMGASRTTARRYLEYLVSTDDCYAELGYGIVGRPERKYFVK
ncbi:MAG: response regulator [Planococcus sp. (in: firmicutes)]|nr:response regulator [Planococcus sp. (in: firmicutes)]